MSAETDQLVHQLESLAEAIRCRTRDVLALCVDRPPDDVDLEFVHRAIRHLSEAARQIASHATPAPSDLPGWYPQRSRERIREEYRRGLGVDRLALEVLLDIRELLGGGKP